MFLTKKITPENFQFFCRPIHPLTTWSVIAIDGGTKTWPRGRRTIYLLTKQGDEYAMINENGDIKLTGRSIGELVRAHSDGYTFFYIEIR